MQERTWRADEIELLRVQETGKSERGAKRRKPSFLTPTTHTHTLVADREGTGNDREDTNKAAADNGLGDIAVHINLDWILRLP